LLTRPEFRGPQGERGEKGERGESGSQGERGLDGAQGEPGQIGPEGPRGPQGARGPSGEIGPRGERGPRGEQGARGLTGKTGRAGERGPQGERGPKGEKGDKGDPGEMGPMPRHEWKGTALRFQQTKEVWGPWVDLRGPRGVGGGGGGMTTPAPADSLWVKTTITLDPLSTTVVHSSTLASLRHADFILNFKSLTTNRERSLKLQVVNDDGTLNDQVYAKTGSQMNIAVNAAVSGPDFNLVCVNGENFAVSLTLVKLII